jgi:hypothetical protein
MKPFRAFLGSNEPLMHTVKQNRFMDKYRAFQIKKIYSERLISILFQPFSILGIIDSNASY